MRRFFRKLLLRRRMHEIADELAFHREMAAIHEDHIPLGNAAVLGERGYDLRRFQFVENLWRDLAYAARGLRRSPGLVLTALASLGLGIGVNAAMFSLGVDFLFSRPSVRDAGSWVGVRLAGNSHAEPRVVEFVRNSGLFADVVGEHEESVANYNDGAETRPVFTILTTRDYFSALGIPMLYGRGYAPDDPPEVVVLNYGFWRRRFGGDPAVVGRAINLDGRMCTVVGILPEDHHTLIGFGFSPEIYQPNYLASTILAIYARLKPGMSIGAAQAGLMTVARRLDTDMPTDFKYASRIQMWSVAGTAWMRENDQALLLGAFFAVLLAVSGLVLLIACINVAGLLLARAAGRAREIAIRLAIGAGRARLLQQLLAESLLLAIMGAALGLALAEITAGLLARIHLPLPLPIRLQVDPDWRLAAYGAVLATFTALACGLLPAWQSVRQSLSGRLHRESRMRLRSAMVGAQIAVSVIVLATGFLFLRNLFHSSAISPGFDVVHTIRANVNLPATGYASAERKTAYIRRMLDSLAAIPGIESVAAARLVPFNGNTHYMADLTLADTHERRRASFSWNAVTPDFFRAMGIPLVQGRTFLPSDSGEHVVIVNPIFVQSVLGSRDPLTTVFLWGRDGKIPYRIVGVAQNTKTMTIGEDPKAQMYEPLLPIPNNRQELEFVMRSAIPPVNQLDAVRRTIHGIEPMAGSQVETMYSSIGLAFLPSQAGALLMGSSGILGLLLATIGLYGVMAYSVARRTREIGVRMAIGAGRGDIARMVLRDAARVTLAGIAAGLAAAALVSRPLALFLAPGMKPVDPVNFGAVALVMLITALAAGWGPARRAVNVDPLSALRED